MVVKRLNTRCLVLNQNYEPLSIITLRRAFCLLYLGKVEVVEYYSFHIHTVNQKFTAPSILRLLYFVHMRRNFSLPLTKQNILKRDHFTCQYCGTTRGKMTTDHVIPKRLGGKDSWENLVCACVRCNAKKGDKPPEEVGMKLRRKPKKPYFFSLLYEIYPLPDKKWKKYIFLD